MVRAQLTLPVTVMLYIAFISSVVSAIITMHPIWINVCLLQLPAIIYQILQVLLAWQDKLHRHKLFIALSLTGVIISVNTTLLQGEFLQQWVYSVPAIIFVIAYTVLTLWIPRLPKSEFELIDIGDQLPRFMMPEQRGSEVCSLDLHGTPNLLLFFRGNWCPFCMAQLNAVASAYKKIEARGIRVVLISPQSQDKNAKLAKKLGVNFLFLRDNDLQYAKRLRIHHASGVPFGVLGYGSDTVYPVVMITDSYFRLQHVIQTEHFRVRPTPEELLVQIDQIKVRSFLEERVAERTQELLEEQKKIDELLKNILPNHAILELKESGKTTPRRHDKVAILFADIVNFSQWARSQSAQEVVNQLHMIYSSFDRISAKFGLEKIKTIGDAYMCVIGIPHWESDSSTNIVKAGLAMQDFLNKTKIAMRMGIHVGSVVTGVVGESKYAYDIYGESVNVAARLEAASEPNKINISQDFLDELPDNHPFNFISRGKVAIKNMPDINMYFISTNPNDAGLNTKQ